VFIVSVQNEKLNFVVVTMPITATLFCSIFAMPWRKYGEKMEAIVCGSTKRCFSARLGV
jgi:hypothetical protein